MVSPEPRSAGGGILAEFDDPIDVAKTGRENGGHSALLTGGTSSTMMMVCREPLAPRSVVCGITPSIESTAARPSFTSLAITTPSSRR